MANKPPSKGKDAPKKRIGRPPKPKALNARDITSMDELIAAQFEEVTAQLAIVSARRVALQSPEHMDEALVKFTNSLSKSVAALSAEERQREKHITATLEDLSPDQEDEIIFEVLGEMPRPRRTKILEHLLSLDDENDLLAL